MSVKAEEYQGLGVVLCEGAQSLPPLVDFEALTSGLRSRGLEHVFVLPQACTKPGLEELVGIVERTGIKGLVVAGCEGRFMQDVLFKRLSQRLNGNCPSLEMVNLRGHVARVHDQQPDENAQKGLKLVLAALAGLKATTREAFEPPAMKGPAVIVGGGIGCLGAASELLKAGIESVVVLPEEGGLEAVLESARSHYPGEEFRLEELAALAEELEASKLLRVETGRLKELWGAVGEYQLVIQTPDGQRKELMASIIIACVDAALVPPGSEFGHDGQRVICQHELPALIEGESLAEQRVVFWITDRLAGHPETEEVSARTAWVLARQVLTSGVDATVTIFHPHNMPNVLSAPERRLARELGIRWVAYDASVRPTVHEQALCYCEPGTHLELELPYEYLVLSPRRALDEEAVELAQVLGLSRAEEDKLAVARPRVKPSQQAAPKLWVAGTAAGASCLVEAMEDAEKAAAEAAEKIKAGKSGALKGPRAVAQIDQQRCEGCGLCEELCVAGAIAPVGPAPSPGPLAVPRRVDPMVCTGDGTCAATCPYHAITLKTNPREALEARVAALARELGPTQVLGLGCAWGGAAAADNAGVRGVSYTRDFYLIGVECIGQVDPLVMARAFLEGANGLLLIGCPPEGCHHTYGIDHGWARLMLMRKLLGLCGIERQRIALGHIDIADTAGFVRMVERFTAMIKELGPIPRDAEVGDKLKCMYVAVARPRVRWVLGATMRRPWEEGYPGDQRNALAFDEQFGQMLTEEYVRLRLVNLLERHPEGLTLAQMLDALGEDQQVMVGCLREMVAEGVLKRSYEDGVSKYVPVEPLEGLKVA